MLPYSTSHHDMAENYLRLAVCQTLVNTLHTFSHSTGFPFLHSYAVGCWSQLTPAHENQMYTLLCKSVHSDITVV